MKTKLKIRIPSLEECIQLADKHLLGIPFHNPEQIREEQAEIFKQEGRDLREFFLELQNTKSIIYEREMLCELLHDRIGIRDTDGNYWDAEARPVADVLGTLGRQYHEQEDLIDFLEKHFQVEMLVKGLLFDQEFSREVLNIVGGDRTVSDTSSSQKKIVLASRIDSLDEFFKVAWSCSRRYLRSCSALNQLMVFSSDRNFAMMYRLHNENRWWAREDCSVEAVKEVFSFNGVKKSSVRNVNSHKGWALFLKAGGDPERLWVEDVFPSKKKRGPSDPPETFGDLLDAAKNGIIRHTDPPETFGDLLHK